MVLGKLTKEQILKGIQSLSDEEKKEVLDNLSKPQEEVQPIETEQGKNDVVEEKAVEKQTDNETNQEENKVDEVAENETTEPTETTEEPQAEQPQEQQPQTEEVATEQPAIDGVDTQFDAKKLQETISAQADKIASLEEQIKGLLDLKAEMDSYVEKQKNSFGLGGKIGNSSTKDFADMTTEELEQRTRQNI